VQTFTVTGVGWNIVQFNSLTVVITSAVEVTVAVNVTNNRMYILYALAL